LEFDGVGCALPSEQVRIGSEILMYRTRRWSGNTGELLNRQRKKQTAYRRKFLGTNLGSLHTILWDEPSVVQMAHQYFTPEKMSNISIRPCWSFLGALAEFRKATISFVMSVHPSVRMEQFGYHWMDFYEIW